MLYTASHPIRPFVRELLLCAHASSSSSSFFFSERRFHHLLLLLLFVISVVVVVVVVVVRFCKEKGMKRDSLFCSWKIPSAIGRRRRRTALLLYIQDSNIVQPKERSIFFRLLFRQQTLSYYAGQQQGAQQQREQNITMSCCWRSIFFLPSFLTPSLCQVQYTHTSLILRPLFSLKGGPLKTRNASCKKNSTTNATAIKIKRENPYSGLQWLQRGS